MARYTPRHAPRHAAPRRPLGRTAVSVVGRPLVSTSLVAAVATSGLALTGAFEDTATADSLTLAVDDTTTSASTQESEVAMEDATRVAADRSATNTQRSVAAAKVAAAERAEAAALARKRQAAQERAARAAERKRVLENAQEDPKSVARLLMPEYGFDESQWTCLDQLWIGESGWSWWAENSSSGAYGIPQSLPGSKMASVASDWRTNPVTQISWGLGYIRSSYGTPCNALAQWQARYPHWY
ncbi:hypothetical protein H9L10_01650 [Phycicoccus endophyticus]|uniref:Lytic transglycosylase domain-containing protein n=1 Tax=Phycicoccus endophyticus TaxID=1690220 RepID=A0A7G9R2K1_9MICO|nr:hypothetical protein [Phycicoccus endophyticus]NHI20716.1 hypothetical protein [Phycicoccus endophyticus]QNN49826.1 hypothetical protein H9L10_01650 [Phycicoccus endophyticus]GGL35459.1 hypothetical protein GCM10012283_17370 [Phycicoccus endophyticus]